MERCEPDKQRSGSIRTMSILAYLLIGVPALLWIAVLAWFAWSIQ